jgi:hypothetical protein
MCKSCETISLSKEFQAAFEKLGGKNSVAVAEPQGAVSFSLLDLEHFWLVHFQNLFTI